MVKPVCAGRVPKPVDESELDDTEFCIDGVTALHAVRMMISSTRRIILSRIGSRSPKLIGKDAPF
jgi:hypothetical protein